MRHKKICYVVSSLFTAKTFVYNHIVAASKDYEVTLIASSDKNNIECFLSIGVKIVYLDIKRQISLSSDLIALYKLVLIFNKSKFDIVHSITPKAGLLSMLAAWIARVPLRIHTFTGQVWVTKAGVRRALLKRIDCLIASLTTHNLVDSPSQRQFLLDEKVMPSTKAIVFAKGSISGVDVAKFKPSLQTRVSIRKQLDIPDEVVVFLFIGRLTRDKGVLDLAQAFTSLNAKNVFLLYVGPDEQNMRAEIRRITENCSANIHFVGHTEMPESYMAAADVLCLPSYREGFGTVVIEAAAVGIPAIASRIYGIADAVVDNETGLLHEPHDVIAIKSCMESMMNNQTLRLKLGEQAKARAITDFNSHLVTQAWVNFYQENLR